MVLEGGTPNLAKFQSQMRSRSTCDVVVERNIKLEQYVSISDEKPLHMRLSVSKLPEVLAVLFQSQMRSRSTCDVGDQLRPIGFGLKFQSQMRSRSTCD